MDWLFAGGKQETIALSAVNVAALDRDHREAYDILKGQHDLAEKQLDKDAKAWADKQVPSTSTSLEAEQWDRAYFKALSELASKKCYEDDKVDGVIARCSNDTRVARISADLSVPREPNNGVYWKELIRQLSSGKILVGKCKEEFQFFYIPNGMQGLKPPSPFLSNKGIGATRNQDNLSWDESGLQLHSDVNDAVVVFDKAGNLVQVFRLSVPIIADVNKRVTLKNGKKIDAGAVTGYRYVGKAPSRRVVNSWDGRKVTIYRNRNFFYTGLAVQDEYRTAGTIFVDIHGPGYTYGCIEAVESLQPDSATGDMSMQETSQEDLPEKDKFLAKDSTGQPMELKPGESRELGTMQVVSPR